MGKPRRKCKVIEKWRLFKFVYVTFHLIQICHLTPVAIRNRIPLNKQIYVRIAAYALVNLTVTDIKQQRHCSRVCQRTPVVVGNGYVYVEDNLTDHRTTNHSEVSWLLSIILPTRLTLKKSIRNELLRNHCSLFSVNIAVIHMHNPRVHTLQINQTNSMENDR